MTSLRWAAGSDIGRRRSLNQDSAYGGPRLLAVADGMGGHAHGEVASTVAIRTLVELDQRLEGADLAGIDLVEELRASVSAVADRLTQAARQDPELHGSGTTLDAMLVDGGRIAAAHIGDSRIYLLRDGGLHRLTKDHTLVQALVDEGRITEAEAAEHPRRSVLVRTLQGGILPEPDLFWIDGRIGDRFLLCSDGATAVLDEDEILRLATPGSPAEAVEALIDAANAGGGPDNVTCVVADLVDEPAGEADTAVVGAAAEG